MAFTGDLKNFHIVDIIQLLHTTRKSGTLAIKGERGECRIIFSNGYIVAASYLDNSIRIGTVLVKNGTITYADLNRAMENQKAAGRERVPLVATLIRMGLVTQEDARKALRKLIEMTIVELIGWTMGAFTFDAEAIAVSPDCTYLPGEMEQALSLDAQMVLMDALRVYDERQRDAAAGQEVPPFEEQYADVLPPRTITAGTITADDLGLGGIDRLEKKTHKVFKAEELFEPVELQRRRMLELLAGFPQRQQEFFISYLERSTAGAPARALRGPQSGHVVLVLLSPDELITHAVMTMFKHAGVPVYTTGDGDELAQIIDRCTAQRAVPVVVYDGTTSDDGTSGDGMLPFIRQEVREKHPDVQEILLVSPEDAAIGARRADGAAVLPKPQRRGPRGTFIEDTVQFLEMLRSSLRGVLRGTPDRPAK